MYNGAYYFIFILVFIFIYIFFIVGRGFFRSECGSAPSHSYLTFTLYNFLGDKVLLGNLQVLN